jgi:hypothetical protein
MYLLDTNVISVGISPSTHPELAEWLAANADSLFISVITIAEIENGIAKARRQLGAAFVVSAFESVSEVVLERLEKGHTTADMEQALTILSEAGLPVQPTWVAFTPWTTLPDYLKMLDWIRTGSLIQHVPAVQLSIRLLIPPSSALLNQPDAQSWLGPLEAANFTYCWDHPEPLMDQLQILVAKIAETAGNDNPYATFEKIEKVAYNLAQMERPHWKRPQIPDLPPPRLTEDWFC